MSVHKFERGAVRNHSRKRQCVDFTGMRIGNITPTDLDGLIDYHNQSFAFMELKLHDAEMDYGQKTALVRVVDAIANGGKRAALFLASHAVDNASDDIPADRCSVRAIYERQTWRHPDVPQTLREAVDVFLGFAAATPTFDPMRETSGRDDSILKDPNYLKELQAYLKGS